MKRAATRTLSRTLFFLCLAAAFPPRPEAADSAVVIRTGDASPPGGIASQGRGVLPSPPSGGVAPEALGESEPFTVCSITINSDEEIRTFRRYLPESRFRFVELTDHASTSGDGESWFGRACASGVRCDVLVLSAHFGNTYAGNYGTTFAGRSGNTLPLRELEQHRCEASCPGILEAPLEAYLFACQTLATTLPGERLPAADVAVLARHGLAPEVAERLVDEARYGSEGTDTRARMRFVFAGVHHLYGFTEVAPSGRQIEPLLDEYLRGVGDYAAHLRRLRSASGSGAVLPNLDLARALEPTCFVEASGFDPHAPEAARAARACRLSSPNDTVASRLEGLERLLDEPGFLPHLPAIASFFRAHPPSTFGPLELATFDRIRGHERTRTALGDLLPALETPALRLEMLRVGLTLGWVSIEEALPTMRDVAVRLLRPPMWGEARDRICGLGPAVLERMDIRAEDVPPETYANEFGIQALACLRPSDERIHEYLARSLDDPREWIARLAAVALRAMKPRRVDVHVALAQQLARPEEGPRRSAGDALRTLRPSDPEVIDTIRRVAPSFPIDWL